MSIITGKPGTLAGAFFSLILAGCAATGPATGPGGSGGVSVAGARAVCDRVASLYDGAQYDNFAFNFAVADRALSEILSLYDDPAFDPEASCPSDRTPVRSLVLASRALALSNQEQFYLAERLLTQAENDLTRDGGSGDPTGSADVLVLNARLMHARNIERNGDPALRDLQKSMDLIAAARIQEDERAAAGLAPLESIGEGTELLGLDRTAVRRIISAAATDYLQSGIALSRGDYDLARSLINNAIRRIDRRQGIGSGLQPRFLMEKAKIELETAFAAEARGTDNRTAYARALTTATDATTRIAEVFPNKPILARAIMIRAKAQEKTGDIDGAFASYKEAFAIYQENPSAVSYESVWSFLRMGFEALERTADPASREALKADMFEAAQIVRSSTVAKEIATSTALASATGDDAIKQLVAENRDAEEVFRQLTVRSIVLDDTALSGNNSSTLKSQLEQAGLRLRDSRVALGLEGNNAVAGAEEYLSLLNKPAGLKDVQASLQPGEAVVQILTGKPVGTVFIIGNDRIDIFRTEPQGLVPPSSIQGQELPGTPKNYVDAILENLRQTGQQGKTKPFNLLAGRQAYEEFLGNAEQALSRYDTLVFSLSGPLAALPMEVLIAEQFPLTPEFLAKVNADDYRDVAWLANDKSISYVPSPRNFVDLRRLERAKRASRQLAVFSGYQAVAFGMRDQAVEALLAANGLSTTLAESVDRCRDIARVVVNLEGLDEDGGYANAIAEKLGARDSVFSGPEAFTQGRLEGMGEQLDDFQILHFNTHGLLWPSPDCFSEPALTINVSPSSTGATAMTDRLLTASEIQQLDLAADLVVLAACDTAGGDGLGGESLSGLARSFFIAGTRALLASHWQISEETTNILMQALYRDISENRDLSFRNALTGAQKTLRDIPDTSHPYYWAPFVLIGDGSTTLTAL